MSLLIALLCIEFKNKKCKYMKLGKDRLIWIDLEMTGLEPTVDCILEIATVVTDGHLSVIEEGPVVAIHQSDDVLAGMNAWCQKQHKRSGLVTRVRDSQMSTETAEAETLAFLKKHVKAGVSPMCGNSVWQDRRFLAKYMPTLEAYFHYRLIDVSTLKELSKRWMPKVYGGFEKKSRHLALADIHDSIDELKYYRQHLLHEACAQ